MLKELKSTENCSVIDLDVLNPINFIQISKGLAGIDKEDIVVVNCATPNELRVVDPKHGDKSPLDSIKNLLLAIRYLGIRKLIHFSTLQVYGKELSGNIYGSSAVNQDNPYARFHLTIENYLEVQTRSEGLQCKVLRASNVFGSDPANISRRLNLVPACFVESLLSSQSITLLSSGKQTRNFVSITDLSTQVILHANSFSESFEIDICHSNYYARILDIAQTCKSVYDETHSAVSKLDVRSEYPEFSNLFLLHGKFASSLESKIAVESRMRDVIGDLFFKLKG